MIFSIKPQIFELKCVFSYFRLKTHITLLLPVYVHSWEQRKLGDEAIEMMAGGDIDKEKVVEDGKYPIYANALTNDGIVGYYNDYFRVKAPAVTVTGRGEVGHAQARMTDFTPVVRLLAIRSNHDCYFLENAINNHKVIVESTGVPQLTVPQLASYNIFFPSKIEEEVKIGEYFNNLDNLITLHQCKCQIDGCRFQSPLAITWEQRKLSEIATMHARIGWQNLRTSEFLDSGDYMLITGTDFIDGAVNFDTCHYVERERYEQDKHIQIRNGSILITKDGTLGKVAYIQGLTMPATLNAGVFNVEIKDENEVDNRYLFQYLKAPFLMDYVDKKATGGTIKHLNQNILVDFPVVLPHKAEQEKIGEYFLAIDHLITLHQCE